MAGNYERILREMVARGELKNGQQVYVIHEPGCSINRNDECSCSLPFITTEPRERYCTYLGTETWHSKGNLSS